MIQQEDTKTIPLPLDPVTEKRGRGRPRKQGGAMTNAQRQAAYRARNKAIGNPVTVTKNIPAAADGYDELVLENDRLREELAQVRRDLEAAKRPIVGAQRSPQPAGQGVITVTDAVREAIPAQSQLGRRKLTFTVDEAMRCALERLAADVGVSRADALERLVYWADESVLKSFVSDEMFNRYLERKRNGKSGV
ncbi:hypothetical protein [Burkholderia pseudomallei]|uniref:hypothetical protein n=1 Tax=Burkholderia pseudomallei TaxID=28450 RepID=UPI000A1A0250|nr:hypothetical protein [Burkholderia pseudomallei]ARK49169.1 hypothetical protein BOC35_23520 [Burkholderia pseudomallei]MCL4670280.1 hypothetical protein [Burkholderia pseudomallei]MEB5483295.1 hypothetical protein [Burkholderia pseudomallei]MEB5490150.1 hypothetical protein [Burkholderia pseudomallei]MEB5496546.1 hypothetical protein [Burkholderia pseudomallei]